MNNQAAQTMPTLPRPYWKAGDVKDDYGNPYNETDLFTDDDMRAMYQQGYAAALSQTAGVADRFVAIPKHYAENVGYAAAMLENSASVIDRHNAPALRDLMSLMLAAAPAASGGECNCASGRGAEHCIVHAHAAWDSPQPPSAASVSERARHILADAYRDAGFTGAVDDALSDTPSPHCAVTLRAIEQALTQQRGAEDGRSTSYSREALEIQGARWRALCRTIDHLSPGWDSGIVGAVDAASAAVRVLTAQATIPQPSADAVRVLIDSIDRRYRENAAASVHNEYAKGRASAFEAVRDELESLLSAASDHQQNAAQGGGEK